MTCSYPKNSGASPLNGGRFGHHQGGSGGGGLLISLDVTHGWHKASSLVKKKHRLYLPSIELVRINRGHKLQSLSSKRKNTRPFSFEAWRKAESPLDENDARKRAF